MSTTINFKDHSDAMSNVQIPGLSTSVAIGKLLYGNKKDLPKYLAKDSLFFTVDTGELYTGSGANGVPINAASVVMHADGGRPAKGNPRKLYFNTDKMTFSIWKDGYIEITGTGGGAVAEFDDSKLKAEDTRLDQVKADKAELNALSDKVRQIQRDNEILQQNIAQLEQKDKDRQDAIDQMKAEVDKVTADNTQLKDDMDALQQDNANLQQNMTQLEQKDKDRQDAIDQMKTEVGKLTAENTQLKDDMDTLRQDNTNLQQNMTQLDQKDKDKQVVIDQLQTAVGQLTAENTQLKDKVAELQQNLTAMEDRLDHVENKTIAIMSLAGFADLSVLFGTAFEKLNLPASVNASCDDGSTKQCAIEWKKGSYDASAAGEYELHGVLTLPKGTSNPNSLEAKIKVKVDPNVSKTAFNWTFCLDTMQSEINIKDMIGYDPTVAIGLNEFYGITNDDETYNASLQKVFVKFYGYESADGGNTNITHPEGLVIPVSLQGVDTSDVNVYPDGYVDFDHDTGFISFERGTLSRRKYTLSRA